MYKKISIIIFVDPYDFGNKDDEYPKQQTFELQAN
jgi:hypothetical protein